MKSLNKKNKKPLIIMLVVAGLLLLASAGYLVYAKKTDSWPFKSTDTTTSTDQADSPDGSNNTPESNNANAADDTYESDKNTDDDSTTAPTDTTTSNGKKTANVSIASVNAVDNTIEIRASITSVIEGTGTCTATVTRNNGSIATEKSEAFVNATSSQCRTMTVPREGATSWSVTVEYNSPTSTGKTSLEGKV